MSDRLFREQDLDNEIKKLIDNRNEIDEEINNFNCLKYRILNESYEFSSGDIIYDDGKLYVVVGYAAREDCDSEEYKIEYDVRRLRIHKERKANNEIPRFTLDNEDRPISINSIKETATYSLATSGETISLKFAGDYYIKIGNCKVIEKDKKCGIYEVENVAIKL